MKFLDALLGRSKPKQPKLDALFGVTGAAITLEAAAGMRPTGQAAVCFKPASGQGFAAASEELKGLLELAVTEAGSTLGQRRPLRLPLGGARRPGDGGPGHQRPPGQLDPGAARLRPPAALLGVRLRRRGGAALPPRLPVQAGHLLPVRAAGRRAATTSWSCGSRPPWAATCRSSRSWSAGSPSGDCRSADSLAVPGGAAARARDLPGGARARATCRGGPGRERHLPRGAPAPSRPSTRRPWRRPTTWPT